MSQTCAMHDIRGFAHNWMARASYFASSFLTLSMSIPPLIRGKSIYAAGFWFVEKGLSLWCHCAGMWRGWWITSGIPAGKALVIPAWRSLLFFKGLHHDLSMKSVQHHTTPHNAPIKGHRKNERSHLPKCNGPWSIFGKVPKMNHT